MRLVDEKGYTMADGGRSLGVNPNLLTPWKQKFSAERDAFLSGMGKTVSLDEENRHLREENRRLRMERDIVKKATACFAKESQ